MKRNWKLKPAVPEDAAAALGFPRPQAQLLYNRGLRSKEETRAFLSPSQHDPTLLPDMDKAAQRTRRAISDGELIGVFGDFDIDGISGAAVAMTGLGRLGARIVPYIPNRADEGHGLNETAVRRLADEGVSLLVTVDCGTTSEPEIELASELGMDTIITDHHAIFEQPPYPPLALVNYQRPDSRYPFQHLTGAGMAYKLAQAVYEDAGKDEPEDLLELVALGTVGDVGPMLGENRYFVSEGLRRMNRTEIPGLRALVEVAGYGGKELDTSALSFGLIPRLNAPGRLGAADISLELLTTSDTERARCAAAMMEQSNRQRQALTRKGVVQAEAQIVKRWGNSIPDIIMVGHRDWNPGILGLIAARLVETYDRPAIAVSVGEKESRASARSVPGFDILEPIKGGSDLLIRFGGHTQAAGFTIQSENLRELADHFEAFSSGAFENGAAEAPVEIEMEVTPSEASGELFEFTRKLAPFGVGNPQPVFASRSLRVTRSMTVGASGAHLKLSVEDSGGSVWDAIAFRQGERAAEATPGALLDLAYTMELNTWRGVTNIQLVVEDFIPSAR